MKKFDISAFCAKKTDVSYTIKLSGLNYNKGCIQASDGYVLASIKSEYPKENEGGVYVSGVRVYNETFEAEKILDYGRHNMIRAKIDIKAAKAACKICRDCRGIFGIKCVSIPYGESQRVIFNHRYLSKILDACKYFGIDEMRISESRPNSSTYLTDGKGNEFAIMPVYPGEAYIDLSGKIHDCPYLVDDLISEAETAIKNAKGPQEEAKAALELIRLKDIKSRLV